MTVSPRLLLVPLAAPLVALLGAACGESELAEPLLARTPAQQLREELVRQRAAERIGPRRERRPPPRATTMALFRRLEDIDAWLDDAAPWDDGPPAWWDPAVQLNLAQRLRPLEAFYQDVESLLRHPDNVAVLQAGRGLAQRTTPTQEPPAALDEIDRFATPDRARLGRWIDLLCARAVLLGQDASGADEALDSLTAAFDLLQLLDDRSMRGTRTVLALEHSVLRALQLVAPGPRVHPVELRAQIDPRLARIGDRLRVWNALRFEVERRIEIAESVLGQPGRFDEDHWLGHLDSSRALLARRMLAMLRIQEELREASTLCVAVSSYGPVGGDHDHQELLDGVGELHDLNLHVYVARMALAMNAFRYVEGEWPRYISDLNPLFPDETPPVLLCRARRLDYKRSFDEVRLGLEGRYRGASRDEDVLSSWSWGRDVLQQFDERSR